MRTTLIRETAFSIRLSQMTFVIPCERPQRSMKTARLGIKIHGACYTAALPPRADVRAAFLSMAGSGKPIQTTKLDTICSRANRRRQDERHRQSRVKRAVTPRRNQGLPTRACTLLTDASSALLR